MSFFTQYENELTRSIFPLADAHDINYEHIQVGVQKRRLEELKKGEDAHDARHGELMARCRQRELLLMTVADYLRRKVLERASLNQSLLPLDDEADGK